jgi:hypothetical protein
VVTPGADVFDLINLIPCPADIAEPLGTLVFGDINTFATAFISRDPAADFEWDGVLGLAGLAASVTPVTAFDAGCS